MFNSNIKKNKRILILFIITITISFLNVGRYNWIFNNAITDIDSPSEYEFFNELKTSDYSSSYAGIGENMNIALHQSYLNDSFNIILNTSDSTNNKFKLPCPTNTTFNSSYTKFEIEDISAPNKTLIVEDDFTGVAEFLVNNHYLSFNASGVGYIANISLRIYCFDNLDPSNVSLALFSAGSNRKPLTNLGTLVSEDVVDDTKTDFYWHNITNINFKYNASNTNHDLFYIRVNSVGGSGLIIDYASDTGVNDQLDESFVYRNDRNTLEYSGILPSNTVDFPLIIDFYPLNNTPKPSEIGLKVNNTNVFDITNGQGNWESIDVYGNASGVLLFIVSADWWDVTCNVSQVQINYTKTDLKASSEFNIAGSGQIVEWNVTRKAGLNYFESRFDNYQINFTIPDTWYESSIRVFNGSVPKTSDSTNRSLGNGYRDVKVLNAGNGTFWYLTADSPNLISSINTYIGTDPTDTFNFTDIAHFNGTFYTEIKNGAFNLSVYSPALINDELNYSIKVESFTAGSVISLADWDISDNVTQYGDFRVHIYWNNNTDAVFLEDTITIIGETNLIPSLPKFRFDASESFNLDLFFNDTGLDAGIDGADITYRLGNGIIRSDDTPLGSGNYRITIDCNDGDFSAYGPNLIEINASKTYYNNQSETVQITILGETDLVGSILKTSFDSTETFNVSLFFNNTVKDNGIFGAIRDVYVNSTPFTPISNYDYGDGNYNITINCDDDYFDTEEYGYFNLSVNIEKSYYYNQSTWFIIYVTGETSLSTTKFPDPSIGYYNSDEVFNITAYFRDIGRNEGINGGLAKIYVKEVSASSYQEYTPVIIDPYGIGYYNITVDCSDPIFNPYGKYNIKINITKPNYYTAEDISLEIVVGNTTLTILEPTGKISYVDDETFDIRIEYEDHTLSTMIIGADITYTIDGTNYRSDNISPNVDDTYNITIDAGDPDFGTNYGYVNIIIRANKTNYINLTRTFTFERQITTQITPFNNPPLFEVMRGLNVTYTFNYSDTSGNPIVEYDEFQRTSPYVGFQYHLRNDGDGNYTLRIDTSNVGVIVDPYKLNFSISVFGNQSQDISLTILVTIIQTEIEIQSWNDNADFARSTWTNVSIYFYFNDTTNNLPIDSLSESDIKVKDFYAGTTWLPGFELFIEPGLGNYKLNISTVGKNSGLYTLQLNISKYPNYNWSLNYIQFYLRGNYTQINMISVEDPEEILIPTGIGNNYTTFLGSDLTVEFNITDKEWNNNIVTKIPIEYIVTFKNINIGTTGTLQENLLFIPLAPYIHSGSISTSALSDTGFYLINITVVMLNYENTTFSFNLTLVNSQINIISISNQGGQLDPFGPGDYYNSSIALDINLEFNITDDQALNKIIARALDSHVVRYINLGTGQNGTLSNGLAFNLPTSTYIGIITTSGLSIGNYLINVSVVILDYKVIPLVFNLTIVSADSNLISITNVGGQLSPTGPGGFYEPTVATNVVIEFNTTDAYFGTIIQIAPGVSYTIYYTNIDTNDNGTIFHSITESASSHSGSLDISSFSIGNYSVTIIINKSNNLVSILSFKLRIVSALSNIRSLTNPGGQLSVIGSFYVTFIGSNIGIAFNTTDAHFGTIIQIAPGESYLIYYTNIDSLENGTLTHTISELTFVHSGLLNISQLPIGNYSFSIIVLKSGNNVTTVDFQLRIIEKFETRIFVYPPEKVYAGLPFTILIRAEYFDGFDWLPIDGSNMTVILYYNSENGDSYNYNTNSTGEIAILIPTYSDTITLNITIQLISAYYHQGYTIDVSDIDIIPIPPGFSFKDILPYLIIAGIAIAAVGGSVGIYRGVIVPKKREKSRILTEVKTIFDDAITLEHVLVLYKGTGTCIFFKSFGSEQIDPELISGFISAISSFGKDLVSQEELNEISYGDKMLLLSDGENIRVALVLGKKASLLLRRNLMEFIHFFEKTYANELPNWRGQLNIFRDAGTIVDDILNTSIILPHEISYEISSAKTLKKPQSRDVLKIANTLMKDSERNFFFIATLLKEATEKTGKETAEIFMGIKELRDKKILMPIEIAAIETPPISQQELNLINQKVTGLVNFSPEDRQKLVNDLAQMGPAEREAYFVSLSEQHEIVSAPIESQPEVAEIVNIKGANKEIKKLKKNALKAKKENDYDTSLKILHNAVKIATTWELASESLLLDDLIRMTKIEDLNIKLKSLEKEAKLAAKQEHYNEAAQKYKISSKIASEIFKLGVDDMTKEVKRLTNKAKEFEKLL